MDAASHGRVKALMKARGLRPGRTPPSCDYAPPLGLFALWRAVNQERRKAAHEAERGRGKV
jgi:hypothetical protein